MAEDEGRRLKAELDRLRAQHSDLVGVAVSVCHPTRNIYYAFNFGLKLCKRRDSVFQVF